MCVLLYNIASAERGALLVLLHRNGIPGDQGGLQSIEKAVTSIERVGAVRGVLLVFFAIRVV